MNSKLLKLYFIMGTQDSGINNYLKILEKALQDGITCFQFREKGINTLQGKAYENLARESQSLCRQYHVPFIIDDDLKLAMSLHADGLHVGTEDMPLPEIKKIIPQNIFLGYSVNTLDDLNMAIHHQVDYIGVGPVFPTQSKADAKATVSFDFLRKLKTLAPNLPSVAIGGIALDNFEAVLETGVDGIAVISAITHNPDFVRYFWDTVK